MSVWRSILRWFGLHQEFRVQITAPGIEVTLAGDRRQVQALMGVIRNELERKARRERRQANLDSGQMVRPTELDEMDSPYALPEAVVVPVTDDEPSEDRGTRLLAMPVQEPSTWTAPTANQPGTTDPEVSATMDPFTIDDIESLRTTLTSHPDEGATPPDASLAVEGSTTDRDTLVRKQAAERRDTPKPV